MNRPLACLIVSISIIFLQGPFAAGSILDLGPEELVQAKGIPIEVPGYSVPSFFDWNGDGLKDLIVGQGGGGTNFGKVRVYLNVGTRSNPQLADYFHPRNAISTLTFQHEDYMGCFPRVVYWDKDNMHDLLVGQADGKVKIFVNIGDANDDQLDLGAQVPVTSISVDLDVGSTATPTLVDWNNNGRTDLIAGALDGKIHIYDNCGCVYGGIPPRFFFVPKEGLISQHESGVDLIVPTGCSSPEIADLDGDGKKDILTGNTEGQLLFYPNVGTDSAPKFAGYMPVKSAGVPIDLPGQACSRPFICYWDDDVYADVLVGAGDGQVRLFRGLPDPGDIDGDGNIDVADFAAFAHCWRQPADDQCAAADLNNNGRIDLQDLKLLIKAWLTAQDPREAHLSGAQL